MAAGRKKVSFVLQFTDATPAGADAPQWRAALQEVETGDRCTVLSYEGLIGGLAAHGVELAHDKPDDAVCDSCARAIRLARERH